MHVHPLALRFGSNEANDVPNDHGEVGTRTFVIGVPNHAQQILGGVSGDLGALLDQGQRFFRRCFVGALARDLRPANDCAQRVGDFVGHAGGEVGCGCLRLNAFGERALLRGDQHRRASGVDRNREKLHAGTRRKCGLLPGARALDGLLHAGFVDAPEHLQCGGNQIGGHFSLEGDERTRVAVHGAVLPFFEEGQAKLVSHPTD